MDSQIGSSPGLKSTGASLPPNQTSTQPPPQTSPPSSQPIVGSVDPLPTNTVEPPWLRHRRIKRLVGKLVRFGLLAALLIVIGIGGYLMTSSYNLRAIITDSKFRQYTFSNDKGEKYRIVFYKNSVQENYNFGTVTSRVLLSPSTATGSVPILVALDGKRGDTNAAAEAKLQECTTEGASVAFSVYIKSIGVNANFCTYAQGVGYESFFGNANSVYFMQIIPAGNNLAQTDANAQKIVNSNPSISDAETIAESFVYLRNN